MHFGAVKSREVLCCACWAAQRDTHIKTNAAHATHITISATHMTHAQGRRLSMDWGAHVHLTFSRSCRL